MNAPISEVRRRWIAAGALLAEDRNARVACPKCGHEFLRVEDVPAQDEDRTFSRYLRCENCGATEVLDRLRHK
jgi:predicted RNA-binding Zn-ribbon protein involved in translation (DUF1610 family)